MISIKRSIPGRNFELQVPKMGEPFRGKLPAIALTDFTTWNKISVLLLIWLSVVGCSGPKASHADRETISNLHPLVVMYQLFSRQNRGLPPPNEQQFRAFITSQGAATVGKETEAVDKMFVSSRDGKPFVVVYGKRPIPTDQVIIYEQEGINGKRMVASGGGMIRELDAAEFEQRVPKERTDQKP